MQANDEVKLGAWHKYLDAMVPAAFITFSFIALFGSTMLRLLVSREFHGLQHIVAFGAFSYFLICIYSMYVLLASTFMDNRTLLVPNLAGAATVVGLLIALTPRDPMLGAGLAVNSSLLVTIGFSAHSLKRLYPIRFPVGRLLLGICLTVPLALLSLIPEFRTGYGTAIDACLRLIAPGLYLIVAHYALARSWLRR